jgi:hypothetical protein
MKASELIRNLQALIEKHGDQNVISSSDDEGNSYRSIYYEPTAGFFDDSEREFQSSERKNSKVNAFCID